MSSLALDADKVSPFVRALESVQRKFLSTLQPHMLQALSVRPSGLHQGRPAPQQRGHWKRSLRASWPAKSSLALKYRHVSPFVQAIEFVRREFLTTLQLHMPRALPASFCTTAGAAYAAAVRHALTRTFETLNADFLARKGLAGTTLTAILISGQLITVANIGDSDAILDTFAETLPMTVPHRITDNESERSRVEATGTPLTFGLDLGCLG
jgi:hypothetical protein